MKLHELLVASALCAVASAQSMTVDVIAPMQITATSGAQTQSTTLGAGPLPAIGLVPIVAGTFGQSLARAEFEWRQASSATEVRCLLDHRLEVVGPATGEASVGSTVVLLTVMSPTPGPMTLQLFSSFSMPAGTAHPLMRVDVGNDGSVEFTESSGGGTQLPVFVGASSLPIRIEMSSELLTAGSLSSALEVRLLPNTNTWITQVGLGCSATIGYTALPDFDGNLEVRMYPLQPQVLPLSFAIFGLGTQALPIGSVGQLGVPCVLLPTPDVVFFLGGSYTLVVPAAARPIDIWTQAITWPGLLLTESYLVQAQ
jgi:hypothetical protein